MQLLKVNNGLLLVSFRVSFLGSIPRLGALSFVVPTLVQRLYTVTRRKWVTPLVLLAPFAKKETRTF